MDDEKEYINAGIYEADASNNKPDDQQTQSLPDDKPKDPDAKPDNQTPDQVDTPDKPLGPDGNGGDKLQIMDETIYKIQNDDGSESELSGKDLKGRMLLKSKYDAHLREHEETVVKPNREAIEFTQQLTTGLSADPIATTSALIANIAERYGIDYGNVLNAVLSEAHRKGNLQNVILYDVDEGDNYVPSIQKRAVEDPVFQQQLRNESSRAFQAEMRADRVEALNQPDIKIIAASINAEIQARADQLYQIYRSNPAFSPIGQKGNQYYAAVVTAWNEAVGMGKIAQPKPSSPTTPSLVNKQQQPKKTFPTIAPVSEDNDEAKYKKWGIY